MKNPVGIVAYHLPTFSDCYRDLVRLPSEGRLEEEAKRIIAALEAEGFEIVLKGEEKE